MHLTGLTVVLIMLTHWGRLRHICVDKLTIIDSDNGLSPGRRQGIIWTYAGILLIGPLGTNFNDILISIQTFSFKKLHLKMSSAKWRPFCLGLNVVDCGLVKPFGTDQRILVSIVSCHGLSTRTSNHHRPNAAWLSTRLFSGQTSVKIWIQNRNNFIPKRAF